MNQEIIDIINCDFEQQDRSKAIDEMNSVTLNHVMAESETNLKNTWVAILKLSKGDLKELVKYVKCAKEDFRDVICWSTQQ